MSSDDAQGDKVAAPRKAQRPNRRLLVVWLTVIVLGTGGGWVIGHNESQFRSSQRNLGHHLQVTQTQLAEAERKLTAEARQSNANCHLIDKSNAGFDFELNQLIKNAEHSTGLTPKQKVQALAAYAKLRLPIVPCAPAP